MFGSNIVVSAPRATHVTERLAALDLLVVADLVMSETAAMADVVLPVTQWSEETGTMTNLEGRVILRQQAVAPPDGVRSDLEVIAGLAERVGSPVPFATDAEEVFAELARASSGGRADYGGITYDRIRAEHGVFWPCPDPSTRARRGCSPTRSRTPTAGPGSSPSSTAARPRPSTRSSRSTSRPAGSSRSTSPAPRPGGCSDLPDTGPFVELHPMLADRIGARDGELVVVTTRRGELKAPARVVTTIRPDTVFVPFHWVGANRLTNDALDPSSRMPEFKVCACAVRA